MPGAKTPVTPTCSGPILRETLNNIRRTNQKMIRGHLQQEKTSKFHKMISREPNFYNRHFHSYFKQTMLLLLAVYYSHYSHAEIIQKL
jgi:hypothetical protein